MDKFGICGQILKFCGQIQNLWTNLEFLENKQNFGKKNGQ